MCGINLLLDRQKHPDSHAAIRRMSRLLQHRGPDAEGIVAIEQTRQQVLIANNRLKIIDLSEQGNQPMQCGERGAPGQRYTLSYNGELYNHFELKNELLQKGYGFRSGSDTEVLLYSLVEWGEGAISRFHGMFAFIFYDKEEDLLLLARDRHGMKPLYYFNNERYLLASSEIKALLSSQLIEKKLNSPQLYHYLQFRYAEQPHTFYQEVYELLPGHCLTWRPDWPVPSISPFQGPQKQIFESSSQSHLIERLEERLTDALFSHLHTDRSVGLFLSGGVDSTLMLALLRKHSTYQLPLCFTIQNKPEEGTWGTEDYLWAGKAAKQYDARQIPVEVGPELLEHFPHFIESQDQPIGDSAAWLTDILSKEAAKEVAVVLSGAGADELFGGYNRHQAFYFYLQQYKKLRRFLPALQTLGKVLPAGSFPLGRKRSRLLKKLLLNVESDPGDTFLNFVRFSALPGQQPEALYKNDGSFEEGWMQAALQHDRQYYLPSDILALNDKSAMQHSLEMRMPYLSEEVSGLAEALPSSLIMGQGRKWLLNELLKNNGGAAYVKRKKEGFGLPFGGWIRQGKTQVLWRWLEQKDHPLHPFVEPVLVQKLLSDHKKGRQDFSQELFSLAVLAHWLQKEFS